MRYILTEEEYRHLVDAGNAEKKRLRETLQMLCTEVANHKPVNNPHGGRDAEPKPHGCVLSPGYKGFGYCHGCPVREVCPYERKRSPK